MITLLVWACLSASPADCNVEVVVAGFGARERCLEWGPSLVAGWLALHKDKAIREGTRAMCVSESEANYLLYRFRA